MKRGNIKILAAATVVIALCLVFSYICFGEDEQGDREIMEPGDYIDYACIEIDPDGNTNAYSFRQQMYGSDGENYLLGSIATDGSVEYYQTPVSSFHVNMDDMDVASESTVIDHPTLGETECVVYEYTDPDGTVNLLYATGDPETGVAWQSIYTDGSTFWSFITGTSLSGPVPEFGHSTAHTDFEAGDFMAFNFELQDGTQRTVVMTVESVEDGRVTYTNSFTGMTLACSAEAFLGGGEPALGEPSGTYLVKNPVYGDRLCNMHVVSDERYTQILLVGVDDGICYYAQFEGADGTTYGGYLMYSNMIDGDAAWAYPDMNEVGDSLSTVGFDEDLSDIYSESLLVTDAAVDGSVTIRYYLNGERQGEAVMTEMPDGVTVGTETMHTPYGALECNIQEVVLDGIAYRAWVYDDYALRLDAEIDGTVISQYLCRYTPAEDGDLSSLSVVSSGEVEEGGWVGLALVEGNTTTDIRMDIVSVDGDEVTYSVDGTEGTTTVEAVLGGYVPDGAEYYGQTLVKTWYGPRVCDIFAFSVDGTTVYAQVGALDGVFYGYSWWNQDDSPGYLLVTGASFLF